MSTKQKLLSKFVALFGFSTILSVGWILKDSVLHSRLNYNNDPGVSITTTTGDSVLIPTTLYNTLDNELVVFDEPMREPMLKAIAQMIKDEAVVKKTMPPDSAQQGKFEAFPVIPLSQSQQFPVIPRN